MSQKFSLSPTVILRSEPQYYGTYAAFDFERVTTEFLNGDELRALEYIYDRPADFNEISREVGIGYGECARFLKRMIRLGYVKNSVTSPHVKPPKRIEINPRLFDSFSLFYSYRSITYHVYQQE